MTITQRAGGAVAGSLAAVLMLLLGTTPHASAQTVPPRGNLVVTGSASPSPGSSSAVVTYTASIKNDGTFTATGVTVTILMPPNTQFVKCSPSVSDQVCQQAGGVVTTTFASVKAHAIVKVGVGLKSPTVTAPTTVGVNVKAHADHAIGGDEPRDGDTTIIATVVPGTIPVEFLPSLRRATVACGDTVGSDFFQAGETTVRLLSSMGCAQSDLGLRIAASSKTLDLNKFKIVGPSSTPNSKGIVIGAGATSVTVIGGSTNGTSGIESFDYGLLDEGGNTGLWVTSLRCFRARSAGLDIVSDGVTVSNVLVDRTVGGSATQEAPGGVGIHASGNVHIVDSIVRRSAKIGIWVDGSQDLDGNHRIAQIDGTTRVEDNSGIGLLLEGQLHFLKDVDVTGDGITGLSQDGIQINGTGIVLDGVQVTDFAGRGIVVNGAGARISRTSVEDVALEAFVVAGANARLSGNSAKLGTHGFVVSGPDCALDTNDAERTNGNGFVVSGDRCKLTNNTAEKSMASGYVISTGGGLFDNNHTERSVGSGFVISGSGSLYKNNSSATSSAGFGFDVTGTGNQFQTNKAEKSKNFEWQIAPGNVDKGSNKKNGSVFIFTLAGGSFE